MSANHFRDYAPEWAIISRNPGIRGVELRKRAGWKTHAVDKVLANMEAQGYLLSEDERGGLYPYARPAGDAD